MICLQSEIFPILNESHQVVPDFLPSTSKLLAAFFPPVDGLNSLFDLLDTGREFTQEASLAEVDIVWHVFV